MWKFSLRDGIGKLFSREQLRWFQVAGSSVTEEHVEDLKPFGNDSKAAPASGDEMLPIAEAEQEGSFKSGSSKPEAAKQHEEFQLEYGVSS